MKPSPAERALDLCRKYDFLLREIATLTRLIGESISWCPRSIAAERDPSLLSKTTGRAHTHLSEAFESFSDDDGSHFPSVSYLDEDEKTEVLAACVHCATAYRHIKDRKAARKLLGQVKRSIRSIARNNPTLPNL